MCVVESNCSEVSGFCTTQDAASVPANTIQLYWGSTGQSDCRATTSDLDIAALLKKTMLKSVAISSGPRRYCHSQGSEVLMSEADVVSRAW